MSLDLPTLDSFQLIISIVSKDTHDTATVNTNDTLKAWWTRIRQCYDEPQRRYHNWTHIESMWESLRLWKDVVKTAKDLEASLILTDVDECVILLAILFHDIVYDPRAHAAQNELESIKLWEDCARTLRIDNRASEHVTALIHATIRHEIPSNPHPPYLKLFLDLDLEVLGRPRSKYQLYSEQIREEYAHVDTQTFCIERSKILERLCSEQIYFTTVWRERCSDAARNNMRWEIDELRRIREAL